MELWVRSQDKTNLVKVNNLANIDYRIVFINNGNGRSTLGTYKTKERALEILDEIQALLKPAIITTEYECDIKDSSRDKTHFNLEMKPEKTEMQQITSYVYEMPEE